MDRREQEKPLINTSKERAVLGKPFCEYRSELRKENSDWLFSQLAPRSL
jgi:hypothetical protein